MLVVTNKVIILDTVPWNPQPPLLLSRKFRLVQTFDVAFIRKGDQDICSSIKFIFKRKDFSDHQLTMSITKLMFDFFPLSSFDDGSHTSSGFIKMSAKSAPRATKSSYSLWILSRSKPVKRRHACPRWLLTLTFRKLRTSPSIQPVLRLLWMIRITSSM